MATPPLVFYKVPIDPLIQHLVGGGPLDQVKLWEALKMLSLQVKQTQEAGEAAEAGGGGHIIQEESTDLPAQPRLNFKGDTVTAADNPATKVTDVTVVREVYVNNSLVDL